MQESQINNNVAQGQKINLGILYYLYSILSCLLPLNLKDYNSIPDQLLE